MIKIPTIWQKYGLRLDGAITGAEREYAIMQHCLVVLYLETHPELQARYLAADLSDYLGYFDILELAKKEYGDIGLSPAWQPAPLRDDDMLQEMKAA